jgi:hypothetical protein
MMTREVLERDNVQKPKIPKQNLSVAWLLLNAAALGFATAHVLVDFHIGLFGESSHHMAPIQAGNVLVQAGLVSIWCLSLASAYAGSKPGLTGAFILAVGWAFLGNGLVAVIAAPPPSAAFPYQDITHFGSLVFGGIASLATWRELKRKGVSLDRWAAFVSTGVIIAAMGVSGILGLSNI